MKAVLVRIPGGAEALVVARVPRPVPGPGEARVRAVAIGVGRPDVLIRQGSYKWMPPLPAIPGNEVAGMVDAIGPGVTAVAVGERVLLSARELPQRGGGYAEYACAPAEALYTLPASIDFDAAVSLPNFQLAQALLFGGGTAVPLKSVLVTAAAGGVAWAVTQTARAAGLAVIATASTDLKRHFALLSGAKAALDPRDPALVEQVMALTAGRGVELALDPTGGTLFIACLHALAPLGMAVSYNILGGSPSADVFAELRTLLGRSLAVRTFSMHSFDADPARRRGLMQAAIDSMATGAVKAPPVTRLPLSQAREAHERLDDPAFMGKLVLHP